ncbi:MAG: DUF1775 domain-containing protein [Alphaproteobacteria bacterium]|nr:DUF1775 domain-containing protein [Alphaproteobacteria bacterium]
MIRLVSAVAIAVAAMSSANAHVTLERQEAHVGAPYKGVLRVPHGCEGTATVTLRVRIPSGVIGVKPMPKPGWTLTTVTSKYSKTYKLYHRDVSEGVTEINWSGGKLADAWYDEFTFIAVLASDLEAGKTIHFPVVQECEKGVHRWIEIPAAGKSRSDYPEPAPELRLLPAAAPRH